MISAHSFARRSIEAVQTFSNNGNGGNEEQPKISPIAALVFLLTVAIAFATFAALSYTFGHLVTTLCMVESPSTNTYVPIDTVDPENEDSPPAYNEDGLPKPADGEDNIIRTKPITASIRGTLAHLNAKAGFWSKFRGFWCFFCWNAAREFIAGFLSAAWASPIAMIISAIIAEIFLANIQMTWVHIIISEPSTKKWWQRLPSPALKSWRKIAPAVAVWSVTARIVFVFPMLVAGSFGTLKHMQDPDFQPGMKHAYATAGQLFLAAFLTIALFFLLQIPATVMVVRVAASMLPEEDETIVPFDRTFGGLTTPEIVGGQGKIGMVEAWRSFNWECRRRLIRTMIKVSLLGITAWILFTTIVMAEAHLLFGDAFGDMMKTLHGISRGRGN